MVTNDWERFEEETAVIHLEIFCGMYMKKPHKARISYPQYKVLEKKKTNCEARLLITQPHVCMFYNAFLPHSTNLTGSDNQQIIPSKLHLNFWLLRVLVSMAI